MNLVIGATGLLGRALVEKSPTAQISGTCFRQKKSSFLPLDIKEAGAITTLLSQVRPKVIFYAVNYPGGVNACEQDREEAMHFHLSPIDELIAYCHREKARLVCVSTDYVFGDHNDAISEDEVKNPLNYYGELKSLVEEKVLSKLDNSLVIRTANIFNLDPLTKEPNFMEQVLRKLKSEAEVLASSNLFCVPTFAPYLAQAIWTLTENKCNGIFHVSGHDQVSRFAWATLIAQKFGLPLSLIKDAKAVQGPIKRPSKNILDTTKAQKIIKPQAPLETIIAQLGTFKEE